MRFALRTLTGVLLVAVPWLASPARAQSAWKNTPALGTARVGHATVPLPDGRVLAIGGNNAGVLRSVESFDPATGRWSAAAPLAVGRELAGVALLPDGRVLVAGGRDDLAELSNVELRDPATGRWSFGVPLPTARQAPTVTRLRDGRALVIGGQRPSAGGASDAVEVFDPVTNAWTALAPLPGARWEHSATLLADGRVLVAGGFNGTSRLASAAVWNPADNSWTATGTMTTLRSGHVAARLEDGKVLVMGGHDGTNFLASAQLFDPATNAWTATGGVATGRRYHAAVLLPSGKVLSAGGDTASFGPTAFVDLFTYDPVTSSGTWSFGPSLLTARKSLSTVLLADGRVLAVGGTNGGGPVGPSEVWTEAADAFSSAGALATPRRDHSATLLADGRVLVAGGDNAAGAQIATAELWNPASGAWTTGASMPVARRNHTATLLGDGRILVAGGCNGSCFVIPKAEVFDPATGLWTATADLINARSRHTATLLADGRVLVAGGLPAAADVWDPSTGTWSPAGTLATARRDAAAILLRDGRVLLAGGTNSIGGAISSVEIFDPKSNSWSTTGAMNGVRQYHTGTLLADGRVLVAAGATSTAALGTVEIWDPATGTWSGAASVNQSRYLHTARLLPDGRLLVLGGRDLSASLASNEIYDPASNTWTFAANLALPRHASTATWLLDGRILAAGGEQAGVGLPPMTEVWQSVPPVSTALANACYPGLGSAGNGLPLPPWPSGATIEAYGRKLTGCGEAGAGSSAANFPQLRAVSLSSGAVWDGRYTRARDWRVGSLVVNGVALDTFRFTVPGDAGLHPGHYAIQAVVNGIPSASRLVRLSRSHDKYYLHRESTLPETRNLCPESPSSNPACGAVHTVALQDETICRPFSSVGVFRVEALCGSSVLAGEHVFPPGGFAEARSVSGSHTLRADVTRTGAGPAPPPGRAYLFARLKRHSDGCLIQETERLTGLNLPELPTGGREAILLTVVAPRTADVPACCGLAAGDTTPCASTTLPAGDRLRIEWWVDVQEAHAQRGVSLALESPGSSAASFPVLSTEVLVTPGPTAIRVRDLSAERSGEGALVSWVLEEPAGVAAMQVLQGSEPGDLSAAGPPETPLTALEPWRYEQTVDRVSHGAWFALDLVLDDGSVERYGPVALDDDEDVHFAPGCGCHVTGRTPVAGEVVLLFAAMAIARRRQARG